MKAKRILSAFLSIVLLFGAVIVPAQASETAQAPTSLELTHDAKTVIDGKIIAKKGDCFTLTALDQNGEETPVSWSSSSYGVSVDSATGEVTVTGDLYASGTSYWYFTATSTLDSSVKKQLSVQATGYLLSAYQKNQTVALSADGQTAKTASLSGGYGGHNLWSFDIPSGVAVLPADPGTGSAVKFNLFRPGRFTATYKLDVDETLSDTATFTVTGIAVEDADGQSGKTYLSIGEGIPAPTVQLTAYLEDGRSLAGWASDDEAVATVDENGLVTAVGIGSAIVSAADDNGTRGGIKVVVQSEDIPYFESLEFATTSLAAGAWVTGETFAPTETEYALPLKTYQTSSLVLQKTTLYDAEKYTATAEYTDINGEKRQIAVKSGVQTTLPNLPFDESVLTVTLADKSNAESKTVYTFTVSRPRDTTKAIKASGIVLSPVGRALSGTTCRGIAEGAMQRADASGALTSGTGVASTVYFYRTFLYDNADGFKLNLTASTAFAHLRYSTDGGESWKETAQGGGMTDVIFLPESGGAQISVQILDDAAYTANLRADGDGFAGGTSTAYTLWVDAVTPASPEIRTAEATSGDWYPTFAPDAYSYQLITANDGTAPVLHYTVADGCTVKIGNEAQTPDENGVYALTLGTSQTSVSVTSEDGDFTTVYKFGYKKKSALDVPDRVVDYLCIGSQYTNASYGVNPELTLAGSLKSLGNFGGYITYYYEDPLTDNPNNKYGLDFYVVGNGNEANLDSMAELGQVYVSEDGVTWYALAGSEHYEDKAHWDYTVTYTKGEDGKAYWSDNCGNKIDYAATAWPRASIYYLNDVAEKDSYTCTGILFDCQDGSVTGDSSSTASFAAKAKFGYADYYASNLTGTTLTEVNPYVEKPSKANGFDLAWAVDGNGTPVDVGGMEFRYVKVATASNIWAGAFKEKSTEVAYVVRTTAQENAVGKTASPSGVTITDGASTKVVGFADGQSVYTVDLGDMKYVSLTVSGAAEDDNIYINNQRTAAGEAATGFKVTKEKGETLVRVLVQNGEKEPVLYLLKLTGSATESGELVEGIKINVSGAVRAADSKDGETFTASVGSRVPSIAVVPCIAPEMTYTVNGEAPAESYPLSYGKNVFEIAATDTDGNTQTVTLTVTRENAPASSDKTITVRFTLCGDEAHGDGVTHTYKENRSDLPVWIQTTRYTVPAEATVLDVLETALDEAGIPFINAGGNYISSVNGLAEFDNGPLSGWMYLINSKHPTLGVAEQTLKNGDRIIFHYTDDYTKEQGSENWAHATAPTTYTVKFDSDGGSSVSSKSIDKNEKLAKPADPVKDGFRFDGWYTDRALTTPYDFDAPVTGSFTLYAKWVETPAFNANTFADVAEGDWYYDAVRYVYEKGLMQGTDKGFEPNADVTRAMVVTLLYRLEGGKANSTNTRFADVADGEWYAEAVAWAVENGIVKGVDDARFAPNERMTREQLAVVLCRYAAFKGYDVSARADLSAFADKLAVSDWALDALSFANAVGLVKGTDETALSPQGAATRAQIAVIFMRLCEFLIK